jgi:hypothetical protein
MKETVGSLRTYLIVVGIVDALFGILTMGLLLRALTVPGFPSVLLLLVAVVDFVFSALLLYTGIALPRLLMQAPQFVIRVLWALGAWIVFDFAMSLVLGASYISFVKLVAGLLIVWYLLHNTRRLATQTESIPS